MMPPLLLGKHQWMAEEQEVLEPAEKELFVCVCISLESPPRPLCNNQKCFTA